MKKKRLAALTACILLCALMIFSGLFVSLEAGHACSGETCEICMVMHVCNSLLRDLSCAGAALALCAFGMFLLAGECNICTQNEHTYTLVSLMVKLQN